jgi:hypothetical protein
LASAANKIILKLLRPQQQKSKMYASWLGLCIGILLLFIAGLSWFNFRTLLSSKGKEEAMSSYIVLGKAVTNESMLGDRNQKFFSPIDIQNLKQVPGVTDVGFLVDNKFPVSASMGGNLGFYTEMFLGAVEDKYLDQMPEDWHWHKGQQTLPIIMSTDFLNLYNYGFALSQGLPQLSPSSIKALPFEISVARGQEKFRAQIVGFTDRISTIIVPESFMATMNAIYAPQASKDPSRIIVKVNDPSDATFINYLKSHQYTTNSEQLRWQKIRNIVDAVVSSVGLVALVVVGLALLSFMLFIENTVQKAKSHIQLMKQIGYAPKALRKTLIRFFIPWILSAILIAILIACAIQWAMMQWVKTMELELPINNLLVIIALALLLIVTLLLLLRSAIHRIMARI